jgi:hypothetical protein
MTLDDVQAVHSAIRREMEDIRAQTERRFGGEWRISLSAPIGGPEAAYARVKLYGSRPNNPTHVLIVQVFRRPPDLLLQAIVGTAACDGGWPVAAHKEAIAVPTDDPANVTERFVRTQVAPFHALVAEEETAP